MKVKMTVGDWSQDGHNQYEEFVFETNKTVTEIQDAYKQSCKTLGLIFDCNCNHTGIIGLDWQNPEYEQRKVFVEYEQDELSELAINVLKQHNIEVLDEYEIDDFVNLMINVIQLSLPDLTMEEASFKKSELKSIPPINGWWSRTLNESWGYGLFLD